MSNKISKHIGIISRIAYHLPPKILITIYYAFIYSLLFYASIVWGQTTKNNVNRLNILIKRFFRRINYADTQSIERFNIMSFDNIIRYKIYIYMYNRISYGEFSELIDIDVRETGISTRNNQQLIPKMATKNIYFTSINCNGPRLFNVLPQEIKNCISLPVFRKHLKRYLLQNNCI